MYTFTYIYPLWRISYFLDDFYSGEFAAIISVSTDSFSFFTLGSPLHPPYLLTFFLDFPSPYLFIYLRLIFQICDSVLQLSLPLSNVLLTLHWVSNFVSYVFHFWIFKMLISLKFHFTCLSGNFRYTNILYMAILYFISENLSICNLWEGISTFTIFVGSWIFKVVSHFSCVSWPLTAEVLYSHSGETFIQKVFDSTSRKTATSKLELELL